jgi:hypothetical protein
MMWMWIFLGIVLGGLASMVAALYEVERCRAEDRKNQRDYWRARERDVVLTLRLENKERRRRRSRRCRHRHRLASS